MATMTEERQTRMHEDSMEIAGTMPSGPAELAVSQNGMRKIDEAGIAAEVILARNGPEGMTEEELLAVEKYRLLCTRILQVARSLKSKVFLVTSAISKDGKSLTTLNLAYGLSRAAGKRTLIMELDLRRPSMKNLLGMRGKAREMSFLESDGDWHDSLWQLRPNLHALLALTSSLRSDVLLQSERMTSCLAEARQEYDFIIMDSAPLLSASDTHALLPLVDQALFVVRADKTPIDLAQEAVNLLGGKALGCILNGVADLQNKEYYDPDYVSAKPV
jgi:capsular exopolysaccharide synthesis family protein